MKVTDTELHKRVLYVSIDRRDLEDLILKAVAVKTNTVFDVLRKHAKVVIEENMEGSPSYASGYKATVRAEIPLIGEGDATVSL